MEIYRMKEEQVDAFMHYLTHEERAAGTIEKYKRDILAFMRWADGRAVTRELTAGWKDYLVTERGYAPVTVNSMLAAVHSFFVFLGWEQCCVKFLKIQRKIFRDKERELTLEDYKKLVGAAKEKGRSRLALLLETICGTGIRVSEVQYITVEAAKAGCTEIMLKGKIRTILFPAKLCRKLLKYAKKEKISSGQIFITSRGRGLSRGQIWSEMKGLCEDAGVDPSKVFPHNLRHLFATVFYSACRDIAKLADLLGHSSIETTRIYLLTTGKEHRRQLDELNIIT